MSMLRTTKIFFLLGLLPSCFSFGPPDRPECKETADCDAGSVCLDEHCLRLCGGQRDCADSQVCLTGVCKAVTSGTAPIIETIIGNDSANAQRVGDGLLLTGAALGNAKFELAGVDVVQLAVRQQTETFAEVVLPEDVRSGQYALTAINQAGSGTFTVNLTLPELDGETLLTRINTQATSTLALARVPLSEIIAELDKRNCPAGYTQDTSETQYVLCRKGPDTMVKVGDFWVDKYESTLASDPDCANLLASLPSTFPRTGTVTNANSKVYACSVANTDPWGAVSWFQANAACASSGKHLLTNAEWQAAVTGTYDPGDLDAVQAASPLCNTHSATTRGTAHAGTLAGDGPTHSSCMSIWGTEDMIGNLSEWTADWWQGGPNIFTTADQPPGAPLGAFPWTSAFAYGPLPHPTVDDVTHNVDGQALTNNGWADAMPVAVIRGGHRGDAAGCGSFFVGAEYGPSVAHPATGFRCGRR